MDLRYIYIYFQKKKISYLGSEAQNLCNKKQKKIKQRKYININVMNSLPKLVKLDE